MSATSKREHCFVCQNAAPIAHSAYCRACGDAVAETRRKAIRQVRKEIASGRIPKASELDCVDCGNTARDYDHRDYSKPLQVVPVCRSCNLMRGPAEQAA